MGNGANGIKKVDYMDDHFSPQPWDGPDSHGHEYRNDAFAHVYLLRVRLVSASTSMLCNFSAKFALKGK